MNGIDMTKNEKTVGKDGDARKLSINHNYDYILIMMYSIRPILD